MNSVRNIRLESLKYQRFATLDSKEIEIIKSEFVAKTEFLYEKKNLLIYILEIQNIFVLLNNFSIKLVMIKNLYFLRAN